MIADFARRFGRPTVNRVTLEGVDAFAKRYFPVEGETFDSRSGTWLCKLDAPVDVFEPDRRVFHLRFNLTAPDPHWEGPAADERRLELRTSLASFHFTPDYTVWLRRVIDGFLDSDKLGHMQEAYNVELAKP